MGIEKEAKGDGKPKHRKLKRLSGDERALDAGDSIEITIRDSTKPNKSAEKTDNGKSKKDQNNRKKKNHESAKRSRDPQEMEGYYGSSRKKAEQLY
ncbi:unnamed protein product [Pleuronectes platessa]|uniref:Uncharacterized protein n=1 Tax=Pleuronectes platessa TaxID=8262 RepID=A0A9N7UND1_PLEPL|nr:unnamed protein product [Pleuronectes platessa]